MPEAAAGPPHLGGILAARRYRHDAGRAEGEEGSSFPGREGHAGSLRLLLPGGDCASGAGGRGEKRTRTRPLWQHVPRPSHPSSTHFPNLVHTAYPLVTVSHTFSEPQCTRPPHLSPGPDCAPGPYRLVSHAGSSRVPRSPATSGGVGPLLPPPGAVREPPQPQTTSRAASGTCRWSLTAPLGTSALSGGRRAELLQLLRWPHRPQWWWRLRLRASTARSTEGPQPEGPPRGAEAVVPLV